MSDAPEDQPDTIDRDSAVVAGAAAARTARATGPAAAPSRTPKHRPTPYDRWGYVFVGPWVLGFLLFTLGPMVASIAISFTDYDLAKARFVGIDNYREIIWQQNPDGSHGDPRFYQSLWNTFYYAAFAVPLGLTGSLLLAMLLNEKVKGLPVFRTIYYLPTLVPAVASSLLWIWILQPEKGLLNNFLGWLFRTPLLEWAHLTAPRWLQDPGWSKPSLILMSLWGIGGSRMLIFLAGLQGISDQYYEAAKIDGAGPWTRFRHVTLPLITPIIFFNLVLGVIGAFQTFTQAYIMTNGGPQNSTLFYALYLYKCAFEWYQMGKASALAWILFVILLSFTYLQFRQSRKWVHYEGEHEE